MDFPQFVIEIALATAPQAVPGADFLLPLQHPPQPRFPPLPLVRTGHRAVVEQLHATVDPPVIAPERSFGSPNSFRSSRSGVIQTFSSSFAIIASIERSLSTSVQTQQPKRLVPQLGVEVSTTSGHSPPVVAPWYMPRATCCRGPRGS